MHIYISLGIIKCVTLTTLYVNSMWWPSSTSIAAVLHETVFLILSSLSAFSYVMATICGPGFLPLKWKPAVCIVYRCHSTIFISQTHIYYSRAICSTFTMCNILKIFLRKQNPNNIFSFVMCVTGSKLQDRITVENADDVSWKWIITAHIWTVWVLNKSIMITVWNEW